MTSVLIKLLLLSASLVCLSTALICPAYEFDAYADALSLHEALFGNNLPAITNLLIGRSGEQRVEIAQAYKKEYKKDLVEVFNSFRNRYAGALTLVFNLWRNNYWDLLVAMIRPLSETYAMELYDHSKFLRTDVNTNVDIFATSSNAFMKAIDVSYKAIYPENKDSLLNHFQRHDEFFTKGIEYDVILAQFQGIRDETQEVDKDVLFKDAKNINDYSIKKWDRPNPSRRQEDISDIFQRRSYNHLHELINYFESFYNKNITNAFSPWEDNFQISAKNMIEVHRSLPKHFAKRLRETMEGPGTNDRQLIRIIVGRSEIDLDAISEAYYELYNRGLTGDIEDDTSGLYQRALLAIVNSKCSDEYC